MGTMLNSKVCLIADAASDIGMRAAEKMAAEGASLILCLSPDQQINPEWLQTLGNARVQMLDFTNLDALHALAADLERLDAMFYNRVPPIVRQRVAEMPLEVVDQLINRDLTGVFWAAKVFGELICKTGGSMVFLSSINAEKPTGIAAAYSMYMGALRNLSREAAMFFGRNSVRSSCIELGPTGGEDEQFANDLSLFYEGYAYKIPSGYVGTAEDVAALACFLSSDDSRYINGAEIRMDGGLLLQYIDAISNANAHKRGK